MAGIRSNPPEVYPPLAGVQVHLRRTRANFLPFGAIINISIDTPLVAVG